MKKIFLSFIFLLNFNLYSSSEVEFYSLFVEEDLNAYMTITQLSNGLIEGKIISLAGNKWFEETYKKNPSDTKTYIQEYDIDLERPSFEYLTPQGSIVGDFYYRFENRNPNQIVIFYSNQAINLIKGFASRSAPFSITTSSQTSWTGSIWTSVNKVNILENWADLNPYTFCQVMSSPEISNFKNLEFGKKNLDFLLEQSGFKCDKFFNLEKKPKSSKTEKGLFADKNDLKTFGSAFSISTEGYFVTNNHVSENCLNIHLSKGNKQYPTEIIFKDEINDIAILQSEFKPKFSISLSKTKPKLLQDIYVAGFPYGDEYSESIKITKGVINSLVGIGNDTSIVQVDAALQPGNSGGPIVDKNGNLVAISTYILDKEYFSEKFGSMPENSNFGVKASLLKDALDSLEKKIPTSQRYTSVLNKKNLSELLIETTFKIKCMEN